MKRVLASLVVSVMAMVLDASTLAPAAALNNAQQTPESAARFLKILVDQGSVARGGFSEEPGWRVWNGTRNCDECAPKAHPDFTLTSLDQRDRCLSAYTYDGELGKGSGKIDWHRMTGIAVVDNTVEYRYAAGYKSRLSFGSSDLAARAALAMDVIRASCDATSGTGF